MQKEKKKPNEIKTICSEVKNRLSSQCKGSLRLASEVNGKKNLMFNHV